MEKTSTAMSYLGFALASSTLGSLFFSWNKPMAFILWIISIILFVPTIRIVTTGSEKCADFKELPTETEYIFVRNFLGITEIDCPGYFRPERAIIFGFPRKLKPGTKFTVTSERKIKITIIEIQTTQSA